MHSFAKEIEKYGSICISGSYDLELLGEIARRINHLGIGDVTVHCSSRLFKDVRKIVDGLKNVEGQNASFNNIGVIENSEVFSICLMGVMFFIVKGVNLPKGISIMKPVSSEVNNPSRCIILKYKVNE